MYIAALSLSAFFTFLQMPMANHANDMDAKLVDKVVDKMVSKLFGKVLKTFSRHKSRLSMLPTKFSIGQRDTPLFQGHWTPIDHKVLVHHGICLAVDDGAANLAYGHGMQEAEKGDFAAAIRSFQDAIEVEPQRAETHHQLGLALAKTGDLVAAQKAFQKVLELDPQRDVLNYAELVAPGSARARAAPAVVPNIDLQHKTDSMFHCGMISLKYGDLREAEKSFREVLEIDPAHADARKQLDLLKQNGDAD
eukprot:gnl/MRDRNA2_/MRDRNA2_31296_c0_seq1.p1 gnl/MRDRNA2_/MRDRNA2_31296_c0~~gnl/MRDRNA2_/MRDRNA2_31296_c0_seq1.p1  ORF type:complete len:250 (-),score=54.48 gnl/MRDRNA2_/MRDRNA2_31296_c0_seq1:28-777(-)